jgi:hypothetical protein
MKMKMKMVLLIVMIEVAVAVSSTGTANFFKPFNVSYDHRAVIIDGKRRMLISAGIHYPRATPEVHRSLIFILILNFVLFDF